MNGKIHKVNDNVQEAQKKAGLLRRTEAAEAKFKNEKKIFKTFLKMNLGKNMFLIYLNGVRGYGGNGCLQKAMN